MVETVSVKVLMDRCLITLQEIPEGHLRRHGLNGFRLV
jgi:hypothetical protein